jgi:hypothetical protein
MTDKKVSQNENGSGGFKPTQASSKNEGQGKNIERASKAELYSRHGKDEEVEHKTKPDNS